jgi:rubrerythrin
MAQHKSADSARIGAAHAMLAIQPMRSIPVVLRAIAASTLATFGCGGDVGAVPAQGDAGSQPGPTPSPGPTGTGTNTTPPSHPTEDGFLPVPCRTDDANLTDLSAVAQALGEDFVGYYYAIGVQTTPSATAWGGTKCSSQACTTRLSQITAEVQALKKDPGQASLPEDQRVWSTGGMAPGVRFLVTGKGETLTPISNTKALRTRLGTLDSPWKAHLLIYAAPSKYAVACKMSAGDAPPQAEMQAFVKAGNPNLMIGLNPAPGCRSEAEAFRVVFSVAQDGTTAELSSSSLWKGPTACEGRVPDAIELAQASHVMESSCTNEGEYFARMAYFEEAAVHAFAILLDELDDLPSEIRSGLEAARADEVRHARMLRRLARKNGSEPATPRIERQERRSLEAIAIENAVEGCVRETYGAVVGFHQAASAEDPAFRTVMTRIAEDEARHADVSWKLASWLESKLDDDANARVRAARERAVRLLERQLQTEPALAKRLGLPTIDQALAIHAALAVELWGTMTA